MKIGDNVSFFYIGSKGWVRDYKPVFFDYIIIDIREDCITTKRYIGPVTEYMNFLKDDWMPIKMNKFQEILFADNT